MSDMPQLTHKLLLMLQLILEVPLPASMPWPPPLDEGVSEDLYRQYIATPPPTPEDKVSEGIINIILIIILVQKGFQEMKYSRIPPQVIIPFRYPFSYSVHSICIYHCFPVGWVPHMTANPHEKQCTYINIYPAPL